MTRDRVKQMVIMRTKMERAALDKCLKDALEFPLTES